MSTRITIPSTMLTRIGFNETDIKVYTTILGLGRLSIGEIMVITGIDPLTLLGSIKNLEEMGFVKKIMGKTTQYFAVLPFLKGVIHIERDFHYAIDGIVKTLKDAKKAYEEKKVRFSDLLEGKDTNQLFDIHVVSGMIKQLLDNLYQYYTDYNDRLEEETARFLADIKNEFKEINTKVMEQPLIFSTHLDAYIHELNAFIKQFAHTSNQKSKKLHEETKTAIETAFQDALEIMTKGLDSHAENHKEFLENLPSNLDVSLNEHVAKVNDIQKSMLERYNTLWDEAYSLWVNESREIINNLSKEVGESFSEQIKETQQVRRVLEQIDRKLNQLSTRIVEMANLMESSTMLKIGKTKKQIEPILNEVREGLREAVNSINEEGLQVIDKHILVLNDTRDAIREKMDRFQISSDTTVRTRKKQIIEDITGELELLPQDLVEKIQNAVEKYAKDAYNSCITVSKELKDTIQKKLKSTSEEVIKTVSGYTSELVNEITKMQNNVLNEITKAKQETENRGRELKDRLANSLAQLDNRVQEKEEKLKVTINELKQSQKELKEEQKEKLEDQLREAEDVQISTVISQVASVIKSTDEILLNQLNNIIEKAMALYHLITTREDELQQLDKAASEVQFEGLQDTSVVVGEEAIKASITDIAMRAKYDLLLIMPEPDDELFKEMSQYTKAQRITLVSAFDRRKNFHTLRNLSERFTGLRLKYYDKKDVYCGILDGTSELVVAFLQPDTVPVAIRTTNELLLQLFKAAINRDVLFHTSDIEI